MTALLLAACSGGGGSSSAPDAPPTPDPVPTAALCEQSITAGLNACALSASDLIGDCFETGDSGCIIPPLATGLNGALATLASDVSDACTDSFLTDLGYAIDVSAINDQVAEQCVGAHASLASRVFGGPTGQVLSRTDVASSFDDASCLNGAYDVAAQFLNDARAAYQQCLDDGDCQSVEADIAAMASTAVSDVATGCTGRPLETLVGSTPNVLIEWSQYDAQCQIAAANSNLSGLSLDCAPKRTVEATQAWSYPGERRSPTELFASRASTDGSASATVQHTPQRGEFVQIELDGASTGAMCGDGSNYRFWMQLAPTGFDIEKVLISVQGGGACVGDQCTNEILDAIDHASGSGGGGDLTNTRMDDNGQRGQAEGSMTSLTSTRNADNPYQNWSKIMLPYCTQDFHAGGRGATEDVDVTVPGQGDITYTIQRTGGHNLQSALRYVRNVIWAVMNEEGQAYDASAFEGAMSGISAGGYGAALNYHFVLDDLRWTNSKAINLIGFSMDDSAASSAGQRSIFNTTYTLWNSGPVLAPYCQDDACAFAETLAVRSLARMDATAYPRQHYSLVSAQVDQNLSTGSEGAGGLSRQEVWGNALRATFCRMRDPANNPSQANLHFFLPLITAHPIGAGTAFPPNNISWFEWIADFETDLVVEDNVDASSNQAGSNTLDPFACTP